MGKKRNKRQKRQEPGWILWIDRSKINYRNKMVACTNGWKLLKRNAEWMLKFCFSPSLKLQPFLLFHSTFYVNGKSEMFKLFSCCCFSLLDFYIAVKWIMVGTVFLISVLQRQFIMELLYLVMALNYCLIFECKCLNLNHNAPKMV